MKSPAPDVYFISRASQIRALAAPTRQEIVDTLGSNGPSTVATLGMLLGRAPDSLYHHIRILLRAGLIRKAGPRGGTSPRGAVYSLPGRTMQIAYKLRDQVMATSLVAVVRAMMRISYNDFERAVAKGDAVVQGPRRNLRSARIKAMLDSTQIEEVNRHYEAIVEIMSTPRARGGDAKLHAVTFMMVPIERSARANRRLERRERTE